MAPKFRFFFFKIFFKIFIFFFRALGAPPEAARRAEPTRLPSAASLRSRASRAPTNRIFNGAEVSFLLTGLN